MQTCGQGTVVGTEDDHKRTRMRANVLLAGSPDPHGHQPQAPAKEHATSGQTRRLVSMPRSRMARTDAATSTSRSGTVEVTGSGAAAAETAATTPMMTVLMPNSMDGATPAHRERKQVLACVCAPMTPRAEMRTCGWAGAGAPSLVSSLSPFRKVLRARFRGRYRSTGSAGLYTRVYRAHSG